jgi:hypothetical protein
MIEFSLTAEQKKELLENTLRGISTEIYSLILFLGHDPDTYDQTGILAFSEREAPSNEARLFSLYNRYNSLQEKIASL